MNEQKTNAYRVVVLDLASIIDQEIARLQGESTILRQRLAELEKEKETDNE